MITRVLDVECGRNLWFTGDVRFGARMPDEVCDDEVVRIWNSMVSPDDVVVYLGNFMPAVRPDTCVVDFYDMLQRLNGELYFVSSSGDAVLSGRIKGHPFYDAIAVRKAISPDGMRTRSIFSSVVMPPGMTDVPADERTYVGIGSHKLGRIAKFEEIPASNWIWNNVAFDVDGSLVRWDRLVPVIQKDEKC